MSIPAPVRAADPPDADVAVEPTVVGHVHVTGNVFTDSTRILRTFDVPPGAHYSREMVRRGTKKLVALGLFSDVQVTQRVFPDGVTDLTVIVAERPRIASVGFSGNKKREDSDLEKKLFMRAGETYSPTVTQTQVDSLLQYYRDEGYPRTKISARLDTIPAKNQIGVTFVVEEGEKVRITAITFEGRQAFTEKRVRKALKTKPKGFFGGGELKDETFAEDREKLEGWYHDHGYRDMRVVDFVVRSGATPKEVTLVVKVDEGPRYVFGHAKWTGNHTVPTPTLAREWSGKPGAVYQHSLIEKAMAGSIGDYAEHGLVYVNVDPRETVSDSVVDLEFAIVEGLPAHIRRIDITGNKGTRENVIRRELDIHEGDLFRKSQLMRSLGNLQRLGLFEEVVPDYAQAESSDVDLIFKVKEKQVGTASAGAGYTSQTGMTGFLELGHNNVLGNGQSLNLHLERGANVENYTLSYTEPWFHDAPTLLGFSVYSTTTILTEFDERRRGGSVRIGRPLPWPDYSRGSIGYTLEKLRISNVRDSIALTGITIGRDELTSTLDASFVRNTQDDAYYPTKGTRLSVSESFTGGPLGGDLSYFTHRYEGRVYFPSLLKGVTTMLRLRLGSVGQYPWLHDLVPDYALFRLGGGSTLDPLRGYMDYQIVPPQNISSVVTGREIVSIDSLTTPGSPDTTWRNITTVRRYPGGSYMELFTLEQQFPIVKPLRGVIFFDAGNVWATRRDIRPFRLDKGAGVGLRMEIPILGNVGFDYGYGFDRDDGPHWQGHFLLGNIGN